MANTAIEARPYAKAIFDLAIEQASSAQWSADLSQLTELLALDDVQALLSHPALTGGQKTEVLVAAMADRGTAVAGLLDVLAENDRLGELGNIAEQFEAMLAASEQRVEASVDSAYALDDKQRQSITKMLKAKLGSDVTLNESIDKSLIGGVVIRVGDMLIDGSIAGRINKLSSALAR